MRPLREVFSDYRAGYWGGEAGTGQTDVRVIRNGDISATGSIRWNRLPSRGFAREEAARSRVAFGDLVLTTSGNCGQVAIVDRDPSQPTCVSNFLRVLRVDRTVSDPQYLFHYMNRRPFVTQLRPFIRGSTLQNLSVNAALAAVSVPLPPLDEQRRIAAVLDRAEALRAKRREALAHLDALTQSIFLDMFGEPMRLSRWPVANFGDLIGDTRLGLVRNSKSFGQDYRTPYVRMNAITANGQISSLGLQRTSVSALELELYGLRRGDLLFNTRNSRELVGKSALVEEDCGWVFNNNLLRIRVLPDVYPQYVAQLLLSDYGAQQLDRRKSGTTNVFAIYYKDLRTLRIPVPPMSLQKAFANRHSAVARLRTAYRWRAPTMEHLCVSLQDNVFKGRL